MAFFQTSRMIKAYSLKQTLEYQDGIFSKSPFKQFSNFLLAHK